MTTYTWADATANVKRNMEAAHKDFMKLPSAGRYHQMQRWALTYQAIFLSFLKHDDKLVLVGMLSNRPNDDWPNIIVDAAYGRSIDKVMKGE
jgi:hypothetical protein